MALEFKFLKPEEISSNGAKPHMRFTLDLLANGAPITITHEGPEPLKGLYNSINREAGIFPELNDWQTQNGTKERRKVSVVLALNGHQSRGDAEAPSDVEAGIRAYLEALSKLPKYEQLSLL